MLCCARGLHSRTFLFQCVIDPFARFIVFYRVFLSNFVFGVILRPTCVQRLTTGTIGDPCNLRFKIMTIIIRNLWTHRHFWSQYGPWSQNGPSGRKTDHLVAEVPIWSENGLLSPTPPGGRLHPCSRMSGSASQILCFFVAGI